MKKYAASALLLSLLLTACQGQNNAANGLQSSASPNPSSAQKETPTPTVAPTVSPTATPVPAVAQKSYKLNKNYDIVPIDPNGDGKVVLLTFDDGPKELKTTEALIHTLEQHQAKAIFFVNGYRAKQNPDLLQLISKRGQTIGNHSWDHIDLKKESNDKVNQQIGDVQQIVKQLTGAAPRFFRPPFGSGNDYVREKAKQEGMLYMTWSNGSLDWDGKSKDKPDEVIKNVLNQLHPGSNILMHELPWTAEALDQLLTKLEEKGYRFVDPDAIEIGN